MTAFWIHRDAAGVVEGGIVAFYARHSDLSEWVAEGRVAELVDAGDQPITIGKPLPDGARVIETRGRRVPHDQGNLFDGAKESPHA